MINLAILSSPILLEDGTFHRAEITLDQAKTLINAFDTTNYTQHSSCLLLGVEPAKERVTCESYDVAIVVKPNTRLEYSRPYSFEEIEEIGLVTSIWPLLLFFGAVASPFVIIGAILHQFTTEK